MRVTPAAGKQRTSSTTGSERSGTRIMRENPPDDAPCGGIKALWPGATRRFSNLITIRLLRDSSRCTDSVLVPCPRGELEKSQDGNGIQGSGLAGLGINLQRALRHWVYSPAEKSRQGDELEQRSGRPMAGQHPHLPNASRVPACMGSVQSRDTGRALGP